MDLATRGRTAVERSALMGARTTRELKPSLTLQTPSRRVLIGCGHRASSSGDPVRSAVSKTPAKKFFKSREVDKSLYPATRILQSRLTHS